MRKRHNANEDYILTGKLFCGHCYAPMVGMSGRGHTGKTYSYYACQTRRTTGACKKENAPKDWIEQEVVKAVQAAVLDDDAIIWIANAIIETSERFRAESSLETYEAQLSDVKKQITNLIRAIEMGVAGDEVKSRMDDLQEQKQQLQSLIAVERIAVKDYDRTTVIGYLESLRDHDPADKAFQQMIIRDIVHAVYLYDDHLKITTDFTGQPTTLTIPIPTSPPADTPSGVRSMADRVYHISHRRTSTDSFIEATDRGFVIVWYFRR